MRLIDYFERGVDLYPVGHCLHDGAQGWTYKDVRASTHRVANGLLAAGLGRGSKAAVYSPNHASACACLLGIARVELKPGAAASADELIHLAKEKLGGLKAPKSVDFIAALPRSPVGKVLKKTLREPYRAGRERKI